MHPAQRFTLTLKPQTVTEARRQLQIGAVAAGERLFKRLQLCIGRSHGIGLQKRFGLPHINREQSGIERDRMGVGPKCLAERRCQQGP
jgi:hypothetical protein